MDMKVVAIVGMGPGVSFAVAKKFASQGYSIAMIARSAVNLKGFQDKLENMGYSATPFVASADNPDTLKVAFASIYDQMGGIDVLVYNAAAMTQIKPMDLEYDQLLTDFKINVASALLATQLVVPKMKAQGFGTILFTGGGFSLEPMAAFTSLGIGKAGIRNLTFSLHKDLKSSNIRVSTVTICGLVKEGTKFDPDLIAAKYWELHKQSVPVGEREYIFQ
jgi:short-subunit dehydrogenase